MIEVGSMGKYFGLLVLALALLTGCAAVHQDTSKGRRVADALDVLPAEEGLGWDVPYPPDWLVCDEAACCEMAEGKPDVGYILQMRVVDSEYDDGQEFRLLYPPVGPDLDCHRVMDHLAVVKYYDHPSGSTVYFVLRGKNLGSGEVSGPSNEVGIIWPWVCEGTTHQEFRDCVLLCKDMLGPAWCDE